MNVVIIGLGRMGFVQARITRMLHEHLLAGFDLNQTSCDEFTREFNVISFDSVEENSKFIQLADVVWLTVSDQSISSVAQQISKYLSRDAIVIHTSGALSSSILSFLPAHYGSIHPLLACPPKSVSDQSCFDAYREVIHVIEGDHTFETYARHRLLQQNARATTIDSDKKALYHAAAVFASNYPVTLLDTAQKLFKSCGFDPFTAREASCRLLESSLNTLKTTDPISALTGPIKRNDENTLELHRASLKQFSDSDTEEFYNFMVKFTKNMINM